MKKRISQAEIARAVGLSQRAVSKALRDEPDISTDTKARVTAAAAALGYSPNRIAASLVSGSTSILGVVFPGFGGQYFSRLFHSMEESVRKAEYSLLLRGWDWHTVSDETDINALLQFRVDGLLVVPRTTVPWSESVYPELIKAGNKIVFIDHFVDVEGACSVVPDNRQGARDATHHLLSLNRGPVAMVNVDLPFSTSANEREEGFREALKQAGIADAQTHVIKVPSHPYSELLSAELGKKLNDYQAIFCYSDDVALNIIEILEAIGLSVPEDVAVAGFGDNIPHVERLRVPLTTVSQNPATMASTAVAMLLKRLNSQEVPPRITVPTRLTVRASTDLNASSRHIQRRSLSPSLTQHTRDAMKRP
ncbi:MAG: LacI family transcriptional regulator [Candidatus Pacebacteria bacterium]|nr:LacI family transcriptional regulator [Candidatus Paceibacterota bacterium]